MNRREFCEYVVKKYDTIKTYPWKQYPSFATFRHKNNKWFAVCMDISGDKIGLDGKKTVSVVNLKCNPFMIGMLLQEDGIFPAYHMNKEHWISVLLDDNAPRDKIKMLVDISYELTKKKTK